MAPEEWPIAAPPVDGGANTPRLAGRGRLSTVRTDFFLDPADRLSEQERALMTGMLGDLLGNIADEIRAALPPGLGPANDGDGQQLVRQLTGARLLDRPDLVGLLLRRADEERIGSAVRARSGTSSAFLQALIADSDEAVSAAAMAVVLARGRRRDRLGQPRIEFDDLPPSLSSDLAFAVAASLRTGTFAAEPTADVDSQLTAAVGVHLARHDESRRVDAAIAALVRALADAGKLDEDLIGAAADEGDVGFLAEALAPRAGVDADAAWDHLLEGGNGRLVTLLRMAGVSRGLAARLLAGLGDLVGISDLPKEIARFDDLDDDRAASVRKRLNLDPSYRAAVEALGGANG